MKFNKCQTSIDDLHLEKYTQEVQEQFWDYIHNVPFIRWMISGERPPNPLLARASISFKKKILHIAHVLDFQHFNGD